MQLNQRLKFILRGRRTLAALFFLMTFISNSFAVLEREWVQRFNGSGNSFDIASGILPAPAEGVYVYGSSVGNGSQTDFAVVKYSKEGNELWRAIWNGSGNLSDQINSAVTDDAGNVYLGGFSTNTDQDIVITAVKVSASGKIVWTSAHEEPGYLKGICNSIIISTSGEIIIAGYLTSTSNIDKLYLARISLSGQTLGKRIIENPGNSRPVSLAPGESGSFYLAYEGDTGAGATDIVVSKFDPSFNVLWQRSFTGNAAVSADRPSAIAKDDAGNVYVCGNLINNSTGSDYFAAKMTAAGTVSWQYEFSGAYLDIPSSITVDKLGNSYITGSSRSGSILGTEDVLTLKLSAGGSVIWSSIYNGITDGIDGGNSVAIDSKGNVVVGGYSDRGEVQVTYALIRYDAAGQLSYFSRYSVAKEPEDFIYSILIDSSDNIYATGISIGIDTDYDIATVKYSESTGIITSGNQPEVFELNQNYPNPFNSQTVISFSISASLSNNDSQLSDAPLPTELLVTDVSGRTVASVYRGKLSPGSYSFTFDAGGLNSGVYFVRLIHGNSSESIKALLIK